MKSLNFRRNIFLDLKLNTLFCMEPKTYIRGCDISLFKGKKKIMGKSKKIQGKFLQKSC